jgi:hypothetical protein
VKSKHATEMEINDENLAVKEENGPPSEQEEVKKIPMLGFLVPGSIVPMAASNGMLIVGSSKTHCDCEFPLQYFLIVAGSIGLLLIVMDILVKYVIKWALEDAKITKAEAVILKILKFLGLLMSFMQVGALIGGSVLIYANLGQITYDLNMKPDCTAETITIDMSRAIPDETRGLVYCDYSMYIFALCLVSMIWVFLAFGLFCFAYIRFGKGSAVSQ